MRKLLLVIIAFPLLAVSCSKCDYQPVSHTGIIKEKYYQPASAAGYGHEDIDWGFRYVLTDGRILTSQTSKDVGDSIGWENDVYVCK